jgi:hypothetical protein
MLLPVSSSPTAQELERLLLLRDPELVEASREVDRTLLRWALELTPLERLRACMRTTSTLDSLRRGALVR